jgi:general secretion pathway protein B
VSLILDALRKADAERERGSVPSLHSQPVAASVATAPKPTTRPNWLWIVVGVALGLMAAALLVMIGRDAPVPKAPVASPSVQPSAIETAPMRPVTAAPPAAPAPAEKPTIAEPAPWPQPAERNSNSPRPDAKAGPQVITLGNVPPAGPTIYTRDQLPPDVRAAVPQIAIGGSVYSPDPTARSLIVNGQLYREKNRLTQDLSLEEIKLRSAIFSFRGYRFEVLF